MTVSALTRLTAGAANETWRFEATGASGKQTCILRRVPFVAEAAPEDSQNLGKAGEARVQAAARQAGVPAAEVLTVLTEADGLGEGYLMAALEGETLPRKILRDEVYAALRPRLSALCGAALAQLHQVAPAQRETLRRRRRRSSLSAMKRSIAASSSPCRSSSWPCACSRPGALGRRPRGSFMAISALAT